MLVRDALQRRAIHAHHLESGLEEEARVFGRSDARTTRRVSLVTLSTSQVEAAPPGKIFSTFTTGWTLDSIPPDMLMPVTPKRSSVSSYRFLV